MKPEDLIIGNTYLSPAGNEGIYMGENPKTDGQHVFVLRDGSPVNFMDEAICYWRDEKFLDIWFNIYENHMTWYASKIEADRHGQEDRIARIHVRQKYEIGEGL